MTEFENPTRAPDRLGKDNDSFDVPDPPLDPLPLDIQQQLNTSGDRIQSMQDEIRRIEL